MDKKYPMMVSIWIKNIQTRSVFCRVPKVLHNIENRQKQIQCQALRVSCSVSYIFKTAPHGFRIKHRKALDASKPDL
jgi:hypothetical protein